MIRRGGSYAVAFALSAVLASGCVPARGTSGATFVRYERSSGEFRVALIEFSGDLAPTRASTDLNDLRPGDRVRVRAIGKDWDQPQTAPELVIVGRER